MGSGNSLIFLQWHVSRLDGLLGISEFASQGSDSVSSCPFREGWSSSNLVPRIFYAPMSYFDTNVGALQPLTERDPNLRDSLSVELSVFSARTSTVRFSIFPCSIG